MDLPMQSHRISIEKALKHYKRNFDKRLRKVCNRLINSAAVVKFGNNLETISLDRIVPATALRCFKASSSSATPIQTRKRSFETPEVGNISTDTSIQVVDTILKDQNIKMETSPPKKKKQEEESESISTALNQARIIHRTHSTYLPIDTSAEVEDCAEVLALKFKMRNRTQPVMSKERIRMTVSSPDGQMSIIGRGLVFNRSRSFVEVSDDND
eukprot:IDg5027t1